MWKPLTGEPCAGELHARFGGRGGPVVLLYPYQIQKTLSPVGASLLAMRGGPKSSPWATNRRQASAYKYKKPGAL
jgi:hypothetical protein